MRRVCIFDLDGTLLNTLDDLADACNHALRTGGYPVHPAEAYKRFVGNGVARLVARALPEGATEEEQARTLALFDARYQAHRQDKTAPYEGILPLLNHLRARGMQLAVLSNKPHPHAVPVVDHYFPGLFDRVLGAGPELPHKPDPAGVFRLLEELGAQPKEAAYIGDSDVDMRTGKAAGLYTIGVSWGFRTKEELKNAGADVIVHKAAELEKIVVDF